MRRKKNTQDYDRKVDKEVSEIISWSNYLNLEEF